MCTFLLVRRRDPLEIGAFQTYSGSSIGRCEVYWNKWRGLKRLRVLSGKRIDTCNDCLMGFKGHINDVSCIDACRNRYVPDQRRLNLGYLLDPS
jgi:hypothetical protein